MLIKTRFVFSNVVGMPPEARIQDQRGQPVEDWKFYVCEMDEYGNDRVVAGPFDDADGAERAKLLEERIDRAAALQYPNRPNDAHSFFRTGFRHAWEGRPVETIHGTPYGLDYDAGHRAGTAERNAELGDIRGLTDRAKSRAEARKRSPRFQAAVRAFIGMDPEVRGEA